MNDLGLKFLLVLIANTKAIPDGYFQSLLGERPTGSKWGGEFTEEHLKLLNWKEFTPAEGIAYEGCRYYRADISEIFPQAVNAACTIEELPEGTEIRVVKGAHGWECVADMKPRPTSVATLITGEHEQGLVIFTVHPGEPMKSLRADRLSASLGGMTVKLG